MATIIVSDPAIRVRSSGGTFSSAGASAVQTPRTTVRPSAPATPAIPIPPTKLGYGTPAESTFSSAAPQPPAPPVSTPSEKTYSSDPPLPTPILPKYYPPTYPTDTPPKEYATLPYVYSVTINNITEGSGTGGGISGPAGANGEVQFNNANTLDGDPGLTYDPTLDKLSVTGNVVAGGVLTNSLFYANGNPWVFASPYGNANVAIYLANYTGLLSGTLSTAAQPNVTSVGTLTNLSVAGNVSANVIKANTIAYANGAPWSFYTDANVATFLPNYTGSLSGTITTASQPNITTVGTLSTLAVTSNITVGGVVTDHLYYANGLPWASGGSTTTTTGTLAGIQQTFRGTGSQTVFILIKEPGTAINTNVFIFGVYQQKSTYTVIGTTLTFTEAPPAPLVGQPDNIEVMIYSSDTVAVDPNPSFTYTGDLLTRIDYSNGYYKVFTYTGSVLTQLDFVQGATTYRKVFHYNPDGSLASITESTF